VFMHLVWNIEHSQLVEGDIFSKYDLQLGSHNAVIGILHFGFKVFLCKRAA